MQSMKAFTTSEVELTLIDLHVCTVRQQYQSTTVVVLYPRRL
jgi:hypothetical protein